MPGAHSSVGGGYHDITYERIIGTVKRKTGLDAYALSLMWKAAVEEGVPLDLPSVKDRTGINPEGVSKRALRPYIHDSRTDLLTGFLDQGRRSRTIYYTSGLFEELSEDELEQRWRRQVGVADRIVVEGRDGPGMEVQ